MKKLFIHYPRDYYYDFAEEMFDCEPESLLALYLCREIPVSNPEAMIAEAREKGVMPVEIAVITGYDDWDFPVKDLDFDFVADYIEEFIDNELDISEYPEIQKCCVKEI